jgi:sulfhydrogenase subunit beta (sulfur reductase)
MHNDLVLAVEKDRFQSIFDILGNKGYRLLGPSLNNSAIIYDEISGLADLPVGYTDDQDGGRYRLIKGSGKAYFDYVVGQHSWKKFLFPAELKLFDIERKGSDFEVIRDDEEPRPMALIGVRPCDVNAIAIHDKILLNGPYKDETYAMRRKNAFIVAVNCVRPGGTCFCASMGTGPKATFGFDIALTEVLEKDRHYFIAEAGSQAGEEILIETGAKAAKESEIEAAEKLLQKAARNMGRDLNTKDLKEILYRNFENPQWDKAAQRCLSCGNCTMVCPTCFCINIKDLTDLTGKSAQRLRKWDSCFTLDHSYIYGGSIRTSARARYRQWLTHKLASWIDQFGMPGCVGCGRCITWCPVGIDITEESRAIRESEGKVEIS